jgi:hydrogenase maturation protease
LTADKLKILIYGYGNPGRQDDALGVMLAEETEKWTHEKGLAHIRTDSNYQLNLEDADEISHYDLVIFADASREEISDFVFEPLLPSAAVEFTMHAVAPSFILHLCTQVFGKTPDAYLMHIKGYEWEFMQEVTEQARDNLRKAFEFLQHFLKDLRLRSV